MAVIQSATIIAAELIGMKNQLGSVEAGKIADMVAVNGNPVDNIKAMRNVTFVMKEGVIYKQD